MDKTIESTFIDCPLCTYRAIHEEVNGTHVWICEECPFVALEYCLNKDAENLLERLNKTQ